MAILSRWSISATYFLRHGDKDAIVRFIITASVLLLLWSSFCDYRISAHGLFVKTYECKFIMVNADGTFVTEFATSRNFRQ